MKNLKILLFTLTLFLFSFTTEKKDEKVATTVLKAEMLGEALSNKTIVVKLEIVDDYLITKFPKPLYDNYNYLYNLKGEKIVGFTQNGKGEFQVRKATSISPIPNSDLFTIYDYRSEKILTYNINSLVEGKTDAISSRNTNKLKGVRISSLKLLNVSNDRLLYIGRDGGRAKDTTFDVLVMTDQNDKVLSVYDDPGKRTINGYMRYLLNSVSANGEYMARVASDYNTMYSVIEMFDFKDGIKLTKRFTVPHEVTYFGDPEKYIDNPAIVTGVYASKDFIFLSHVTYSNYSNYRVPNNDNASHSFIVLNLKGEIVYVHPTDRVCFSFVYNEKDHSIYAVVRNEDGRPQLAKYKLEE